MKKAFVFLFAILTAVQLFILMSCSSKGSSDSNSCEKAPAFHSGKSYTEFTNANSGDYFIDTDDYVLYQKNSDGWSVIIENFGKPGDNGLNGESGNAWHVGETFPTGKGEGDMFLNTSTWEIYQFDGNAWRLRGKIDENKNASVSENKIVDLVIFAGQSNMAGRGTVEEAPIVEEGHGYEFRAVSDPTRLYNITEPFGVNENNDAIDDGESKTGSMVSAFAESYYSYTGVPIVGVSASEGGQSINFWANGSDGLNETISRYNSAKAYLLSNSYTIRHNYLVWCQGEADGVQGMSAETYKSKLVDLFNQLNAYGIEKAMIIRIGERNYSEEIHDEIIKAQTELCKVNDDFVLISGLLAGIPLDEMKDYAHFTQKTYNELGYDAGKNMAYYVNTGMEPYFYDKEYDNYYPFGEISEIVKPVDSFVLDVSDSNNGYDFSTLGTIANGKVSVVKASAEKYLSAKESIVLSDSYSWTYQIVAGNFYGPSSGAGMVANSGSQGSGFITVPYTVPSAQNQSLALFRFRDKDQSLQIDVVVPDDYDPKAVHHFALTYNSETRTFKAYIDMVECEVKYTVGSEGGGFNDTVLKYFLGGYPTEASNFAGDFYYFSFVKDVLSVEEMCGK